MHVTQDSSIAATKNDNDSSSLASSPAPATPPMYAPPSNQLQLATESLSKPPIAISQPTPERPIAEIIEERFPPFDHQAEVVGPFTEESEKDITFEQELGAMLLDVILETHAWAAARPKRESEVAAERLEQDITALMETEKEQEKTRERLTQFIVRMKTALAALTGL
ncbi:hypothetical protein BDN72DRAFT_834616 [Pluteus cervinus]|uniref:Uncharacterized protein n=1 Tax=Pluteus cervinus TaxID=181527 RepID=A0ACD3B728_9AGAR|nr:hypothetical protein BDN72DRAFT_834616 [Pluteus cervinus]